MNYLKSWLTHSEIFPKFQFSASRHEILFFNFYCPLTKIHPKILTNNLIRRRFFVESILTLFFDHLNKSFWYETKTSERLINEHIRIRYVNGNNPRLKNWNLNEPFEKLNSQTIECWSNQTNFQLWLTFIHYQNRSKKSECGRRIRLALRHLWYNLNHHKWDQLLWFYFLFHMHSLFRHRMDQNDCRNACPLDFHRLNRWKMLSTVNSYGTSWQ